MRILKDLQTDINKLITTIFPNYGKPKPITGVNCIMRLGIPGSGKTLDQTIHDVLPHLLAGEQVYSSYWLNWNRDNLHLFQEFEDIENVRNCVVVFDEIGQILPARQWENEGLRVQLFFQLHRHRHVDIIGNTQDVSLVAKTVGIVANKWYLTENANNFVIDWLLSIFGLHYVVVNRYEMTYQQLKKMASGWELEGIAPHSRRGDKHKKKWFNIEKLEFNNLDEYKIELVHTHCPLCKMRQGEQILKENTLKMCDYDKKADTYYLKQPQFCPKHTQQQLIVLKTGLYDTDYEPIFPEKTVTFQPMIESPKGYTKIRYQGKLSSRQLEVVKGLKNTYNDNN
jgi:hypothetical protein